jgi:hypothetical protein
MQKLFSVCSIDTFSHIEQVCPTVFVVWTTSAKFGAGSMKFSTQNVDCIGVHRIIYILLFEFVENAIHNIG